jgi:hypothetical protein
MIDMTLLPAKFREGWVAICACSAGAGMHVRHTLEIGDIIRPITTPAYSFTCLPPENEEQRILLQRSYEDMLRRWQTDNTLLVGKDVSVAQLYPDLWDDWRWAE